MKKNQVPQDESRTYGGHRKLFYAVDNNGEYDGVQSTGWEAEEQATCSAIAQLEHQRNDAWQRANKGLASPLEYHMYHCRMDVALLAQTSGIYKWRIKRHFKRSVFNKLSHGVLERYCEAMGLDIVTITSLPSSPQ